jgi:hypothetical protein
MPSIVDVNLLPTASATHGVPTTFNYEPTDGQDRIALMAISVHDPNESYLGTVDITCDAGDVAFKKLVSSTPYAGMIVAAVAIADDLTDIEFSLTIGTAGGGGSDISYRVLQLTVELCNTLDAALNTAYAEITGSGDQLSIDVAATSATDLVFAVGGTLLGAGAGYSDFSPSPYESNAEQNVDVPTGGEISDIVVRLTSRSGVGSTQAIGFGENLNAEPFGLLGFIFRSSGAGSGGAPGAGGSATVFNCECDCGPANKTLAAYRRDLLIRCGFAAIANNPPPGTTELMDAFLRDAQEFLYKKYPALHTKRFFRWTMEEGKRFYGILENDDSTQPRIPVDFSVGVGNVVQVAWNGYDAPPNNRGIFFTTPESDVPLALPYGMLPNTLYYSVGGASGSSNLALTPGGTPITVQLGSDTSGVSHGYAEIRQAIFDLAPYADIEGAWLVDLNGSWLPMTCGIPPTFYTTVSQPGLPVRYEIRSCIEVFPAPAAAYSLYIKGHFGLRPFELDSDKPTIDGHLVYLWALANALDYYGKPSAAGIATQAQDYLGQLVAGTHTGKRYVPGMRPLPPAIIPIFAPWPGGDP